MTAEIAIFNRHAIALAADSAVTIGKERVWKNGNKLFTLGPSNDIAIMIYGAGEFVGFPWEVVVKAFRSSVADTKYDTVEYCAKAFLEFISGNQFQPDKLNRMISLGVLLKPIEAVKKAIPKSARSREFRRVIDKICEDEIQKMEESPVIDGSPSFKEFRKMYEEEIKSFSKEITGYVITKSVLECISSLAWEFFRRQQMTDYETGVVIAGYGRSEYFPSIMEFTIDGKHGAFLRHWVSRIINANGDEAPKTYIVPFGQIDMFQLFMEGVAPEYLIFARKLLLNVLNDKSDLLIKNYVHDPDEVIVERARQAKDNEISVKKFMEESAEYRRNTVVQPILDVVRALPKEEMADMAQALVELTSLRRKVDSSLETVGGPVDIAVISKGDGLIWIKRKHYFDIAKNQDFLYRKSGQRE